ncbi:MAG: hypothetical protein ACYTGB_13435 [Planctomycetota bacterium]|jgi:hypothetical protein
MRSFRQIAGPALAALLLLAGCNGGETYRTEQDATEVEAPLPSASHYQLEDVPVPAVLSFDRANSIINESPDRRDANLIYKGRAHVERVTNFFRDRMPLIGWKLERSQVVGTRALLTFTKGKLPERCEITVERTGMGSVRVTVDLN